MRKSKKEKNREEYLDVLYRLYGKSPERMYVFLRGQYLTEYCNYPYKNANMIAEREWNRLMEKVEKRKRYD